jgi:hypothetical protein
MFPGRPVGSLNAFGVASRSVIGSFVSNDEAMEVLFREFVRRLPRSWKRRFT